MVYPVIIVLESTSINIEEEIKVDELFAETSFTKSLLMKQNNARIMKRL